MTRIREHWSSRFGFLMAAVGSAIGLGILWKFPYTIGQNGGGLFLLCYFVCLVVVGIPLLIAELMIGRKTQKAAVLAIHSLDVHERGWKIAGWFGVFASFLIMSFYSVIAGWGMSYILMSLNGFYEGLTSQQISAVYDELASSGGITLFWHFLFTLITMGIVIGGVRKGIEKWAKIMTRILLFLLIGLFLYGISLDGFDEATHFIFKLNTEHFRLSSAIEALGLAFWTLSIGQGIMISYGSYMKKDDNIASLSGIIALSVILVAILAALTIFPVVFTFGLPAQAGPGLIFKTLPFLFAQLPASLVISTLFFVLFVFTALTSAIPLIEVVATNIMELTGLSRKVAAILVASGTFLFGIPSALALTPYVFPDWAAIYGQNFLLTIDGFVSTWVIPIGGFITAIFVGWVVQPSVLKEEFCQGGKHTWLWRPWHFFMRYLVPLTILIIIVQKSGLFNFDRLLK